MDRLGRCGPVDAQLGRFDLGRVGRLPGLGHRRAEPVGQRSHQQIHSQGDQAVPQLVGRLVGADGRRRPPVDGTGVHLGDQPHEAHARLGVAGQDGPLHRGRAPPPGQEREVDVDEGQSVEEPGGDDPPVGDDHGQVGIRRRRVVQAIGHRQPQLGRGPPHRGGLGRGAPPPPPVGAGDHQRHLVAGLVQSQQERHGGRRRPQEGDAPDLLQRRQGHQGLGPSSALGTVGPPAEAGTPEPTPQSPKPNPSSALATDSPVTEAKAYDQRSETGTAVTEAGGRRRCSGAAARRAAVRRRSGAAFGGPPGGCRRRGAR